MLLLFKQPPLPKQSQAVRTSYSLPVLPVDILTSVSQHLLYSSLCAQDTKVIETKYLQSSGEAYKKINNYRRQRRTWAKGSGAELLAEKVAQPLG